MTEKGLSLVRTAIDSLGGIEAVAAAIGIGADKIRNILKDPRTTQGARNLADVIQVVSGIVDAVGLASANPITTPAGLLLSEQLGILAGTITSGADLLDSANKVSDHWENGEYDKLLRELGNMTGTLGNIVSEEKKDQLQLDRLQNTFNDFADKAEQADKVVTQVKGAVGEVQSTLSVIRGQEAKELEGIDSIQNVVDSIQISEKSEAEDIQDIETRLTKLSQQEATTTQSILEATNNSKKTIQHELSLDNAIIANELKAVGEEIKEEQADIQSLQQTLNPPESISEMIGTIAKIATETANSGEMIRFVIDNVDLFTSASDEDQSRVLDSMLDSGVLDSLLKSVSGLSLENVGQSSLGGN